MKTSLLAVLALLTTLPAGAPLRFAPEEGSEVKRQLWTIMDLELSEVNITHNDEDYSPELPSMTVRFEQRQTIVDSYVKLDDERLLVLKRTYEELSESEVVESDMEDASEDTEKSSELEGETVVFRWDEDEEAYVAAFEESEADEDLLEELSIDLDMVFALPESGELEEGDSWEFEDDEIDEVLQLGGNVEFDDPDEDEEEPSSTQELFDEAFEDNMEGTLTCTYAGEREVNGLRVGVVELELQAHGEAEAEESRGPMEMVERAVLDFDMEGELLWDLEANRLHAMSLEGDFSMEMGMHMTGEMEGESFEMDQSQVFAGEVRFGLETESE